jgi:hypothetical protein
VLVQPSASTTVGDQTVSAIYRRVKGCFDFNLSKLPLIPSYRYCNMDYIWLSTLKHSTNKKILSIYDIMCQWRINLFARTAKAPDFIRRPLDPADLRVAIPKFHLLAHGDPCQVRYSLNFMHGVGRVDGEGVERCWSVLNGISRSTRQMGPGSRKDTIEDHCGHSNWRKIVNKGENIALI